MARSHRGPPTRTRGSDPAADAPSRATRSVGSARLRVILGWQFHVDGQHVAAGAKWTSGRTLGRLCTRNRSQEPLSGSLTDTGRGPAQDYLMPTPTRK